jgi:hypothetical protein
MVAAVPSEVGGLPGVDAVDPGALPDPGGLLDAAGMRVTTMGRDHTEDPLFFRSAVAAGVLAARMLEPPAH